MDDSHNSMKEERRETHAHKLKNELLSWNFFVKFCVWCLTFQNGQWLCLLNLTRHNSIKLCFSVVISVTRFGDISPFWQNLQSLGHFLRPYLLFGKNLDLLWLNWYAIWQIFIDVIGQMLKNNLSIWSHWSLSFSVDCAC